MTSVVRIGTANDVSAVLAALPVDLWTKYGCMEEYVPIAHAYGHPTKQSDALDAFILKL